MTIVMRMLNVYMIFHLSITRVNAGTVSMVMPLLASLTDVTLSTTVIPQLNVNVMRDTARVSVNV